MSFSTLNVLPHDMGVFRSQGRLLSFKKYN